MKYPIYAEHFLTGVVVKLTEKSTGTVMTHTKSDYKNIYPVGQFSKTWSFAGRFNEEWREYNPIWC